MKAYTLTTIGILKQKYPNNEIVYFKGKYYII